jgi:hypothetical protein
MRIDTILLLLWFYAGTSVCFAQMPRNDVSVGGIGVFTLPSPGHFVDDGLVAARITQANRDGLGASLEYRRWWGNNAAGLLFSKSPTNSTLLNPDESPLYPWNIARWSIQRDEVDVLYTRRFQWRALQPYVTGGLGAEVLNGGPTESGLDGQFAYVMGAGEDIWLSRRFGLRTGFIADSIHAPTYMDPTYHSVRTWMFEPRCGIEYSFGFGTQASR